MAASVNSMPTRIFNSTLIYDVILVVVLGGIGLSGGRGGVLNVIIGTLLIGTMLNGMTIMDVSYSGQNLVKGVVLLVAVIADSFLNPRNEETAQQGDDECLDYREAHLARSLHESCPQGVDVYFDNVGGEILDAVLSNIAIHGRVVLCGRSPIQLDGQAPGYR